MNVDARQKSRVDLVAEFLGAGHAFQGVRDAVDAPRMDHEWFPNRIRFMGANDPEHQAMVEALRAMGHDITRSGGQGDANSIQIINGVFYGAADAGRGKASGY